MISKEERQTLRRNMLKLLDAYEKCKGTLSYTVVKDNRLILALLDTIDEMEIERDKHKLRADANELLLREGTRL